MEVSCCFFFNTCASSLPHRPSPAPFPPTPSANLLRLSLLLLSSSYFSSPLFLHLFVPTLTTTATPPFFPLLPIRHHALTPSPPSPECQCQVPQGQRCSRHGMTTNMTNAPTFVSTWLPIPPPSSWISNPLPSPPMPHLSPTILISPIKLP